MPQACTPGPRPRPRWLLLVLTEHLLGTPRHQDVKGQDLPPPMLGKHSPSRLLTLALEGTPTCPPVS